MGAASELLQQASHPADTTSWTGDRLCDRLIVSTRMKSAEGTPRISSRALEAMSSRSTATARRMPARAAPSPIAQTIGETVSSTARPNPLLARRRRHGVRICIARPPRGLFLKLTGPIARCLATRALYPITARPSEPRFCRRERNLLVWNKLAGASFIGNTPAADQLVAFVMASARSSPDAACLIDTSRWEPRRERRPGRDLRGALSAYSRMSAEDLGPILTARIALYDIVSRMLFAAIRPVPFAATSFVISFSDTPRHDALRCPARPGRHHLRVARSDLHALAKVTTFSRTTSPSSSPEDLPPALLTHRQMPTWLQRVPVAVKAAAICRRGRATFPRAAWRSEPRRVSCSGTIGAGAHPARFSATALFSNPLRRRPTSSRLKTRFPRASPRSLLADRAFRLFSSRSPFAWPHPGPRAADASRSEKSFRFSGVLPTPSRSRSRRHCVRILPVRDRSSSKRRARSRHAAIPPGKVKTTRPSRRTSQYRDRISVVRSRGGADSPDLHHRMRRCRPVLSASIALQRSGSRLRRRRLGTCRGHRGES